MKWDAMVTKGFKVGLTGAKRAVMAALRGALVGSLAVFSTASLGNAAQIDSSAEYAYVTDFASGKVLMNKQGDAPMKPASMTKIMTVYITFLRIKEGGLSMDDKFLISEKAWRKGGSKTFVEVGKQVSVYDLLHGVIVQSGNDAAIALAEGISGTEEGFADEMNFYAAQLGLTNTVFRNATGWPDPELITTAKDLNILATAMIREFPSDEYPELYPIFAKKNFTYNDIKQGNRNPLMYGVEGADGLKTGHTNESGYGLVGSAQRGDQRIIMVLNGMQSSKKRSTESRRLMDLLFREYKHYSLFKANEPVDRANVWLGDAANVNLVLDKPLGLVLSRAERRQMKVNVKWSDPIPAPIAAGDVVGTLEVSLPDQTIRRELRAAQDVAVLGLFDRVGAALKYLIFGASVDPAPAN